MIIKVAATLVHGAQTRININSRGNEADSSTTAFSPLLALKIFQLLFNIADVALT